jgi:lipid A 3-O-deacylase
MSQRPSLGSALRLAAAAAWLAMLLLGPVAARAKGFEGWGASAGLFDVSQEEEAVEIGADYGFRELAMAWGLAPVVGLGATTDEAVFAYAGLRRPFELGGGSWHLVPSLAVTLFERGDGKDLGQTLQFRSGLELRRQLRGGTQVGAGIYHISNGSLDDINPGANSLLLRWVLPRRR